MTVSILSAAKRLGEKSDWMLSNLVMQKLAYIAHMFHLGGEGEALVQGQFEAWDLGPVHPKLYHTVKGFGSRPVGEILFRSTPTMDEGVGTNLLDAAVAKWGSNASQLIAITHSEQGAWARNYKPGKKGTVIPNAHIAEEYRTRTS